MEKMKSEHPITEMADALEVSASGYADHLHKDQLPRRMEDRRLQAELVPIFEQSRSTYGSPRLHVSVSERYLWNHFRGKESSEKTETRAGGIRTHHFRWGQQKTHPR